MPSVPNNNLQRGDLPLSFPLINKVLYPCSARAHLVRLFLPLLFKIKNSLCRSTTTKHHQMSRKTCEQGRYCTVIIHKVLYVVRRATPVTEWVSNCCANSVLIRILFPVDFHLTAISDRKTGKKDNKEISSSTGRYKQAREGIRGSGPWSSI